VILALQIDDAQNDYICTFKINNVDVIEKEQQSEKNPEDRTGSRRSTEEVLFDHYLSHDS